MENIASDHVTDDASIVSDSTNMSDIAQNLHVPELGYRQPQFDKLQTGTMVSGVESCPLSPLVPIQMSQIPTKSVTVNDEETSSEMSEPLIPIISKTATFKTKTTMTQPQEHSNEFMESQAVDESQSLLPQEPVKIDTQSKSDITSTYRNQLSKQSPGEVTLTQPSQSQGEVTGSHLAGEISQSQESVTRSEKDPIDKIISRLDRLVSSLDKVPRRQMMVIEATVVQCISSLQDSLNNKLKKQTPDTTGILRRLLETSQNGLMKLAEIHKSEKSQYNQRGQPTSGSVTKSQLNQSNDLAKRQKRVFDLLKRQKYLVEFYRARKRSVHGSSFTEFQSSQQSAPSSKDGKKEKSGDTSKQNSITEDHGRRGSTAIHSTDLGNSKVTDKSKKKTYKGTTVQISKTTANRNNIDISALDISKCHSMQRRSTQIDKSSPDNEVTEGEDRNDSQDVTTIPDTQELNHTQESLKVNVKDITEGNNGDSTGREAGQGVIADKDDNEDRRADDDRNNDNVYDSISKSENELSEFADMKIKKGNNDSIRGIEETVEKLKNEKGAIVKNKGVDKYLENTVKVNEKIGLSEGMWLNMLLEDAGKKADTSEAKPSRTKNEVYTATKIDIEKPSVTKSDIACRPGFQFTAPNTRQFTKAIASKGNDEKKFILPKDLQTEAHSVNSSGNLICKDKTKIFDTTGDVDMETTSDKDERSTFQRSNQTSIGLSSPPHALYPSEAVHNVSPTATSMSSDIFVVKMKDLEKRMKNRAMLTNNPQECLQTGTARINSKDTCSLKHVLKPSLDEMNTTERKIGDLDNCVKGRAKVTDTVSDAIDSVIKQARDLTFVAEDTDRGKNESQNPGGEYNTSKETHELVGQDQRSEVWTQALIPASQSGSLIVNKVTSVLTHNSKGSMPGLPSLKDLLHSGQISHGKGVLTCHIKGRTHRASVTPLGKVRSQDGPLFTTASEWVTSLTDGAMMKKRKAYEMVIFGLIPSSSSLPVMYKGRPLLSLCEMNSVPSVSQVKPCTIIQKLHPKVVLVDQSTQVQGDEIISECKILSEDEQRLRSRLSTSVIRLLTEQDFVSCDDLPDNFWTEDFSNVRLHKDIWDTVDAW